MQTVSEKIAVVIVADIILDGTVAVSAVQDQVEMMHGNDRER
jgi:hypothetical protein